MNRLKLALVALLVTLLSACGDGMTGTYTGGLAEDQVLTFHGNGKATQETAGMEVQLEYEVDGDRIKLRNPDQPGTTLVLTRKDADTLTGGPMGVLEFKRKQ
ncbi:hypothetical protein [Thermomonas sp.]|uniref:hypothetical protein n=1 Tax=Thermomonas sp. TaxID=1971895 RepID=UPI0026099FA1|nr:hypothetical protein [Thermomonas sp.]MCO5055690.1 hypothetical protein [Thermomonas sp.]HRO62779.1 hypothetical protein [Thermomonas sp.]